MELLSFIEIKDFIYEKIKKYTVDDFYLGKHPYFTIQNTIYQLNEYKTKTEIKGEFSIYLTENIFKEIDEQFNLNIFENGKNRLC